MNFSDQIIAAFKENANPELVKPMEDYMRGKFTFFGIKSPQRKEIGKPFIAKVKGLNKSELIDTVEQLWNQPQRELQTFANELFFKGKKHIDDKKDIDFLQWMVINKSWWDTIDFTAPKLMKVYFDQFPEERNKKVDEWIASDNIWLKRSALLIHLKQKENIDLDYMFETILRLCGTKEFFIDKAIGWDLREHSKRFPVEIRNFIDANKEKLSNLSIREGSKYI